MPIAIEVKNVAKKFRIIHLQRGFITLRDVIGSFFTHPIKTIRNIKYSQKEVFWALQDVNFQIQAGEIVGIIGSNGAGKSTLLKILSRITPPTKGEITIHGKVVSMLEVGTGFHPELTGRENIFLNGAILGMPKKDIISKFEEIVAFAQVRQFLDTPVKHYSSGMYVRLAFAVAVHMDCDILFIDEVLAVGDSDFQKKCLEKMSVMIAAGDKTILFVSHNLAAIQSMCPRTLLFAKGRLMADGQTASVVEQYLQSIPKSLRSQVHITEDDASIIQLINIFITNSVGKITDQFTCEEEIVINLECQVNDELRDIHGRVLIIRDDGAVAIDSVSHDISPDPFENLAVGQHNFKVTLPKRLLTAGKYSISCEFLKANKKIYGTSEQESCVFELVDNVTALGSSRVGLLGNILVWQKY